MSLEQQQNTINLLNEAQRRLGDAGFEYFDKLFANKDTIETQLGIKLEWQRECSGNVSRVKYKLPGLDYDNHSNYDELINKSIDIAANMQKVFKKYI